jgi:hypothetical protein
MMTKHSANLSLRDRIPIDMVFTYVDGNRSYPEKRQHHKPFAALPQLTVKEAETRFLNVGEIRFSVRSALKYMPWLRRIFIVTDSQKPPVDIRLIESGKVEIIDHKEFIPEKHLPTFNSITIESFIHRISGLSEIFLYNNDDFMHFSDIPESAFITSDEDGNVSLELNAYYAISRRIMHFASQFLPSFYATLLANPHTSAISNAYRLLKNSQYRLPWNEILAPRHFTHIYRKRTALRLEEEFAVQLNANRKLRFRTSDRFSYSTLAYSLERKWNPGDRLCLPEFFNKSVKSKMYDFTALFSCRNKLWQQVMSSQAMFACLNNIPQSDKSDFERVMREKGLCNPCGELRGAETLIKDAGK